MSKSFTHRFIPVPKIVEYVGVIYADGTTAKPVTDDHARRLIRAGEAKAVGRGPHLRCIQFNFSPGDPIYFRAGTTYSDTNEADDNPKRVWKHSYKAEALLTPTSAVVRSICRA